MMLPDERQRRLAQAIHDAKAGRLRRLLGNPFKEGFVLATILAGRFGSPPVRVTARTFFGRPMTVLLPEPVSRFLYRNGVFEADLTQAILTCLRPGQVFFDVGAHFGYYSLLAAEIVGPEGRVVAFEPTPRTHRILADNVESCPNVEALACAVHSQKGTLELTDLGPTYSAFNSLFAPRLDDATRRRLGPHQLAAQRITVEAWSLDAFVRERGIGPDFVKIDAESAELAILAGMQTTLATKRPLVALEVGDEDIPGAPRSRETVDFMMAKGYEPWEVEGQTLKRHQVRDTYPFGNLLFAPTGEPPRC
jgi:FkbM family methyltransferase